MKTPKELAVDYVQGVFDNSTLAEGADAWSSSIEAFENGYDYGLSDGAKAEREAVREHFNSAFTFINLGEREDLRPHELTILRVYEWLETFLTRRD